MPERKERRFLNLEFLHAACDPTFKPKPISPRDWEMDIEEREQAKKERKLKAIRRAYTWEWNAGAEYLYSELIRAYGLDDERRAFLLELAKPMRGRKTDVDKVLLIVSLKKQGMTAKRIAKKLGMSVEGVESYSKRRRRRSPEEVVRAAMQRTSAKKKPKEDV